MQNRMKKATVVTMAVIFSLAFTISCSTNTDFVNWSGFFDLREPGAHSSGALARFASGMRSQPGNPESHYLLACYYQERGEHQKAIDEFGKVVFIEPTYSAAYNGLGVSYDGLKDYSRAVESYQIALKMNSSLGYVLNNLGYSYLLQGRPDEAVSTFQKAIALNPGAAKVRNNLGLAYAIQGRLDMALIQFRMAGDEGTAQYNIARLYHKQGLYRIARIHYTQALTWDPSFSRARAARETVDAPADIFPPELEAADQQSPALEPTPANLKTLQKTEKIVSNPPVSDQAENGDPALPAGNNKSSARNVTGSVIPSTVILPGSPTTGTKSQVLPLSPVVLPASGNSIYLEKVGIEISNGNGVNGTAKKVGHYLSGKGLPVKRFTNADHFSYGNSRIYYRLGYREAARRVAEQLPGLRNMEEGEGFDRPNIHVKVLIGKDLTANKVLQVQGGKQS